MKIDVSTIPNFESMSAEKKVEALIGLDIEVPDNPDLTKLKNSLNKANSEAAEYKRALKELQAKGMTDAEKAQAQFEETLNTLKAENETLKKAQTIAEYKANYLSQGYDDVLAKSTAEALVNGDMATVFANQKTFNDTMLSKAKDELLKSQPGLSKGNPPSGDEDSASVEAFKKAAGLL